MMFVGLSHLVCNMKKVLLMLCFTFSLSSVTVADDHIAVVDYSVAFSQTKIGKEIREKVSYILSNLRKQFADLEDKLKAGKAKKSYNPKSAGVVFDKKIDFDATAYMNSSEKDKHLMLYTLAQKKSNEISDLAAQAEKNLRILIKKTIEKVAGRMKLKVVLDKSAVVYSDACTVKDITKEVIKQADADIKKFEYPKGLERVR